MLLLFSILISIYSLGVGKIHCDNFKQPYIVYWLDRPQGPLIVHGIQETLLWSQFANPHI
jgi:hypothetical protein